MIEGLKILLERMKTHPEEFIDKKYGGLPSKWSNLVERYRNVLTDEEVETYQQAYKELQRQHFTAHVLECLLEDHVELDPNTYTINTVGRDPWGSSVVNGGNVTLNQKPAYDYYEEYKKLLQIQITEAKKNLK